MVTTPPNKITIASRARGIIFLVFFLVLVVAVLIAATFLGNPYFAIGNVILYVGAVTLVAFKLWECMRLAKGTEYHKMFFGVIVWLALTVLGFVSHVDEAIRSDNKDYIRTATSVSIYLALLSALQLVEALLKKVAPEADAGKGDVHGIQVDPNAPADRPHD